VNKDDYIIYFVYTPVPSVNYCDRLGRCFRFVCIYAGTSVFLCCNRFSANKDLYIRNCTGLECFDAVGWAAGRASGL